MGLPAKVSEKKRGPRPGFWEKEFLQGKRGSPVKRTPSCWLSAERIDGLDDHSTVKGDGKIPKPFRAGKKPETSP